MSGDPYERIAYWYETMYGLARTCYDKTRVDEIAALAIMLKADSVLDTCCGTGNPILGLAKQGFSCVAFDASKAMLAICQRHIDALSLRLPTIRGDWRSLKADLESHIPGKRRFGLLLCLGHSISHMLTDDDLHAALTNFGEVLSPGGTLLIDHRVWRNGPSGWHWEGQDNRGAVTPIYPPLAHVRLPPAGERCYLGPNGEPASFTSYAWIDDDVEHQIEAVTLMGPSPKVVASVEGLFRPRTPAAFEKALKEAGFDHVRMIPFLGANSPTRVKKHVYLACCDKQPDRGQEDRSRR